MSEQAKKMRLQHTLSIAGIGVFAFCVWSLAKITIFLYLVDEATLQQTISGLLGIKDLQITTALYISLVVIVIVDVVVRGYVGLSARAEGHGKKKGSFYLVVAVLAAIANICSLVAIAFGTTLVLSPLNMVVSIIVEATAVAALVLVVRSAVALRRMDKAAG